MTKTVLFAHDESTHASSALSWVFTYILKEHDKLVVSTVVPDAVEKEAAFSRIKTLIRVLAESHNLHKVDYVVRIVIGDKPQVGNLICDLAREIQPSMLVLGSAGKTHIQGFLIGSVSQHCVAHATCPVIVARLQESNIKTNPAEEATDDSL
ncbi:uncharacterized protein BJ171DRAFT_489705 [Polychytrium aggregatum]|uniref:uncharacterized protein n=1 Tax=Polychytrium aggregatum TaxID=110093 RepID=UPI0022FF0742|nr:uncharacterized protein BJ171DRAFT_489705 [Polychytrium aggregatum]KAI9208696.1 hypothetical protein BJ171DRAFT_489705 [Polychytrium aggregatum]